MTAFGVFFLTLGLAGVLSFGGFAVLRLLIGNYVDGGMALLWEAFMQTPYRPISGRMIGVGFMAACVLCAIGQLLLRPERRGTIRRVIERPVP